MADGPNALAHYLRLVNGLLIGGDVAHLLEQYASGEGHGVGQV